MIVHEGHTDTVKSVAFSPDGKSVASGSRDMTIRTWDAHGSSPVGEPLKNLYGSIQSIAYSPLGNSMASVSSDKTIPIWDIITRQRLESLGPATQYFHPFFSVAFSPDARLIVSGCGQHWSSGRTAAFDNSVRLWDLKTMKSVSNPFSGHTGSVYSAKFSPSGTQVASGSGDNTVRVWDVEHGATIVEPLKGHTDCVRSIAYSPDGSKIVSCSNDHTLRLWDTRTGKMIGSPYEGHTNVVHSVDFSPRGTYVVSGGRDDTVRLWDVRTSREVQQFNEHSKSVWSVAFSPCGQCVASGSADYKVIIRNISCEYPESADYIGPHIITSQMSTQQIFDCLIASGCVDLSSQMDTRQDAAIIVSGGGFGDIWNGQLHNGEKVAIKAWRASAMGQCDYKTLKRAARELYCWSRMEHPNIHQLQGVIIFRDQYLGMVSEWMENGNLHEYLLRHPDVDRYELCVDVAAGLEYMHSNNTVHGDLKA
ncbi:unnamed protein product, partial [Rhizoctonia solani]